MIKIASILFIFFVFMLGPVNGQQLVDGVVAIVGQEIILASEVEQYVQNYVLQNKINVATNPELFKSLKRDVLERLIEQKILLTKADEDTIQATDREVDRYLEEQIRTLIERAGSEDKLEAAFQSPMKKIKRDLRAETENRLKIETLRRTKFQSLQVSRREVEKFYQTYKDSIPNMKETVDVSHILKQVKAGGSSADNALKKIMEIKEKIDSGGDFSKLAEQYSEDPGTSSRGGDLGFINRGDLVKEFEEVAFSLEPGQVSDPVQTQFGFHIIKLIEKRGEKIHTVHILIQLKPSADDEKGVMQELQVIREKILNGEDFDSLAVLYSDDENVGNDKGHLGRWEVDKLAIPEFKKVVTSMKVGEISQPFKTDYGYHIVKLNQYSEPRDVTLEKDWEQIKGMALNFKIEKEYKDWILAMKKDIPIEYKISFD
jgi:peptidyl-prolyl cis-trans isomerase SurA